MNNKSKFNFINKYLLASLVIAPTAAHAKPTVYNISPRTVLSKIDGSVVVDVNTPSTHQITKAFYGADTNGFSKLPSPSHVRPLGLGYVKFGGNLYSMFNWRLNLYNSNYLGVQSVSPSIESRIQYVQSEYHVTPAFQVNMLGWQPEYTPGGSVSVANTADADHAAKALLFFNGTHKIGLKHILMGNEPFLSGDTHKVQPPSADEYIARYVQYAQALREAHSSLGGKQQDLKLWGPEIATGWIGWQTGHPKDCREDYTLPQGVVCSYGNGQFSEFIPYFLSEISKFEKDPTKNPKGYKMLDYLTWHYYPLFRKHFQDPNSVIVNERGLQDVAGMLESTNVWTHSNYKNKFDSASPRNFTSNIVHKFASWRDQFYPNALLAVTEFGIDSVGNIEYHPIVRPLYLADLMARLGESGVETFFNSFLQGRNGGDQWGMINSEMRTRLYWIYSLFSNNYLGQVIRSSDSFGDKVNSYAVRNDKGLHVFIVNKGPVDKNATLVTNSDAGKKNITDIKLSPWSLSVVTVVDDSTPVVVQQYGATEMGIPADIKYQ